MDEQMDFEIKSRTILDPSVGFGSLIHKIYSKKNVKITAIEKDKNIFKFVKNIQIKYRYLQ